MGVPELSAFTVAQKAALCLGSDMWHTAPVPEHGVEALVLSDGPHGLRRQPDGGDHAGIGGSLPATCFPPAVALGSAWDPELAREVGAAIGREARAQGVAVVLGPGINIKRSPLCGRNFEYVSEDPLPGRARRRRGSSRVCRARASGACVKHFAANNQETDRLRVNAEVDERTLREIYLPALRARRHHRPAVDGHVRLQQGQRHVRVPAPLAAHRGAARGVGLRRAGDVRLGRGRRPGARAGRRAGPGDAAAPRRQRPGDRRRGRRRLAARGGARHRGRPGAAARRSGRAAGRPPTWPTTSTTPSPAGPRRRAWCCCATTGRAPAGEPRAGSPSSGRSPPPRATRARAARRSTRPGSTRRWTRWSRRCPTRRSTTPPGSGSTTPANDGALAEEAVRAAAGADVVVAYLGLPAAAESEGFDRTHIDLPAAQTELLARLGGDRRAGRRRARQRLGRAHPARGSSTPRAVLECWLGGQAVGGAIADVLTGAAEPGGRLAETHPAAAGGHPVLPQLPRRGGPRPLRRRRVRRLPRVRRGGAGRWPTRSATGCPTPPSPTRPRRAA